ncbi:MAG: acyltransferase [Actinomycetota bacterium]|nr:MAG: acyltransferase [Actinomycetota bacterium]
MSARVDVDVSSSPAVRPGADHVVAPNPTGADTRNRPLDGLRGLGTVFVLVGHLGILSGWWPSLAGVLAVSMFFTLSGYLIATGLLRGIERDGTVRFGRFYARRIRRLLPAATVSIALISTVWWITGRPLPTIDIVSSLTYWHNWALVAKKQGYDTIFNAGSPVQHFWSLAIEEQFYIVLPALLLGLIWIGRRRLTVATWVLGAATVVSFCLGAVYDANRSRVYYGTDVRAAEFLSGVLLAIWLSSPERRAGLADRLGSRAGTAVVTAVWLVQLVLWWRVGFYSGHLFPLLVFVNAVCSVVLITTFVTTRRRSAPRHVLSWRPVSELGRMSYSVYLLHWPIYLLLDRPGPVGWKEALLKLFVAVAAGVAMFLLVEDAVQRSRRWRTTPRLYAGLVIASAVAVAGVLAPGAGRNRPFVDTEAIEQSQDDFLDDVTVPASPTTAAPEPSASTSPGASVAPTTAPAVAPTAAPPGADSLPIDVQRVLLVGDSNGFTSSIWLDKHPEALPWQFKFWSGTNCGTTSGASRVWNMGKIETDVCPNWLADLNSAVQAYRPDVVLVVSMGLDLQQHDLGDGVWRSLGDPLHDAFIAEHQRAFVDIVAGTGARVGWFVQVPFHVVERETGDFDDGDGWFINRPESIERMNVLLEDLAANDPRVVLVPFDEFANSWPDGPLDEDFRPDGAHLDGSREDVAAWMIAQVDDVAAGRLATR